MDHPTYRKVAWRIIPLLFICYIAAYLDRVNVGFAKLQMQNDVPGLSESAYGFGAGLFFFGYFFFEVPSNILMEKLGARLWIARIMISWGIISSAMLFVNSTALFYLFRFILGFAEAGFFPGIILYLTYWFPSGLRSRAIALFMLAIALTGVIGGPMSGWILHQFDGVGNLRGWQMLFLIEGIPSILIGFAIPWLLPNGIRSAKWLDAQEKIFLEANLRADEHHKVHLPFEELFLHPKLLMFCAVYFSCAMGLYGTGFWIPQLIKNSGVNDVVMVGLLTAIPYGFGAIGMVLLGRNSDRLGERRWHFAVATLLGAVGIVVSNIFRNNTSIAILGLTLATVGILATFPLFWPMPIDLLTGTAAAAGIAWVNSVGNLAGFFGPSVVGWITDLTKRTDYGLYLVAAILLAGGVIVIAFVPRRGIGERSTISV